MDGVETGAGGSVMVNMVSQCRTRRATAAELTELDRELGPVDKTSKGTQHRYDEQLLRPHRVVPRHKGDSRRQK